MDIRAGDLRLHSDFLKVKVVPSGQIETRLKGPGWALVLVTIRNSFGHVFEPLLVTQGVTETEGDIFWADRL